MALKDTSFVVEYEIEDGYVGGKRPQTFNIHSDDFESEMTDSDLERVVYDAAQEDMHQKCGPVINNLEKFITWARQQIADAQ